MIASFLTPRGSMAIAVVFAILLILALSVFFLYTRQGYISGNRAAPTHISGQIIVDPDHPRWFKYHEGGPFFMCGPGDPEDFLYRGMRNADGTRTGDQMALIDKLKGTGANSIYLIAVRSHGGDGDATHNPFVDNDPGKGVSTAVLDQWESWFTEMDKNGIVIFFFFYDDGAKVWDTGNKVGSAEKNFIDTLVNRFEHHKNLIWVVAEEYPEAYSKERVSNIAAEIRSSDDYDHPVAVHQTGGLIFDFPDDPNIDQFAIQFGANSPTELHNAMVTAWENASGRYNLNLAESSVANGNLDRKSKWAAAMGGTYVMIFGMDIENTPITELEDCGRLVRFMTSTNFYEMAPHDELKYAGTEYVLALPGKSYIAYASSLPESGMVGLRNMAEGAYDFKWFDPASGQTVTQQNVTVSAGDKGWVKPSVIGSEVALYIKRVDMATGSVNKDLTSPTTAISKDFRYDDSSRWTEDSLAVWAGPDPDDSLLFITHKRGKVDIWNLKTNKIVNTLTGFKSANGVTVDQLENAVYVTDPLDRVVKKYFISALVAGDLSPALTFGGDFAQAPNPMGVTVYHDKGSFVYVTYNSKGQIGMSESYVRVFKPDGTFIREWGVGKVELESIKADDDNKVILVADESNNLVRVYRPDGAFIQDFGVGVFGGEAPDAEGIDIYECDDDGYIIVSDQKVNEFVIFDRKTYKSLARFKVDTALDTDGIALTQASLFNYPDGGFFAQSSNAYVEGVSWSKIATATGMTICMNGVLGP